MESLVALSLASNLAQLVTLGLETIRVAKAAYQSGSVDSGLAEHAARLSTLSQDVEQSLRNCTSHPQNEAQNYLVEMARQCCIASLELHTEVKLLSPPGSKGSLKASIKASVKAMIRTDRVHKLGRTLARCQREMDSGLLLRICSIAEAQSLQSGSRFDKLDASMQAFVSKLADGNIEDTIHIRSRLRENDVNDKLRKREGLLGSLKFSSMNQRANSIKDAHFGTFQWIFSANLPAWDTFVTWLASDEKLYWMSGKAGSGKSTLTKFVVADEHTKALLKADTTLVSHYFWSAGEAMQKSVKGFLFTALYQLLCEEPELVDRLVGIGRKDNENDWSTSELRHWTVHILSVYPRRVCMFLDGADEISPVEGPTELMDLVQELLGINDVKLKICISSRPEPAFKKWLAAGPMLRLQDLTTQDLRNVCSATLVPLFTGESDSSTPSTSRDADICSLLVDELTAKAEGVFLWVHLALKSVRRGRSNSDSRNDILQRIQQLPAGLEALYNSMWERVQECDHSVYDKRAALYLGLILDARKLLDWGIFKHWSAISVFEFMVASNNSLQDHILSGGLDGLASVACKTLEDMCATTEKEIVSSCGGFLEVGRRGELENPFGREYGTGGRWDGLLPWTNTSVAFIHRTASDFLTDTDSGRRILEQDLGSRDDRLVRLDRSALVQLTLWGTNTPIHAAGPSAGIDSLAWDMFRFRHIVMGIGMSISDPAVTYKALSSCEWLWNTILIPAKKKQGLESVDFLALAARGGYYHFVASRLFGTSVSTASESPTSHPSQLLSNHKMLLLQWLQEQDSVPRAFEFEFFSWMYSPHVSLGSTTRTSESSKPPNIQHDTNHVVLDAIEIHARFVPEMNAPKTTLQACEITNKLVGCRMDRRVTFHIFPGREKLYRLQGIHASTELVWGHNDGVEVILLEANVSFLLLFLQGLLQADWPGAIKTKTLELHALKNRASGEVRRSIRCVTTGKPAKELDPDLVLRYLVDMFAWCSSPTVRGRASEALAWSCMSLDMYSRIFN